MIMPQNIKNIYLCGQGCLFCRSYIESLIKEANSMGNKVRWIYRNMEVLPFLKSNGGLDLCKALEDMSERIYNIMWFVDKERFNDTKKY